VVAQFAQRQLPIGERAPSILRPRLRSRPKDREREMRRRWILARADLRDEVAAAAGVDDAPDEQRQEAGDDRQREQLKQP
jgi:hypothetical protein